MPGFETWARIAVTVFVLALTATHALADERVDEVEGLLGRADAAMEKQEFLDAAEILGDAAVLTQEHALMWLEIRVALRIDMLASAAPGGAPLRLRPPAVVAPGRVAPAPRPVATNDVLVTLLRRLDPRRGGAFVSSHALAMRIVIDGTTTGTPSLVGVASDALKTFARAPGSGAAARMWADYARGLAIVENHIADRAELQDAVKPLQAALDVCVKQGWQEPAMYVGTELACVRMDLEQPELARAALESVMRLFPPDSDQSMLLVMWRRIGDRRFAGMPANVRLPHMAAVELIVDSAASPRRSESFGSESATGALADAWPRLARKRVFVEVKRDQAGFQLRHKFGPKPMRRSEPYRRGMRTVHMGGVGFLVHAQAVAPAYVSTNGGGVASSSGPSRGTRSAWYFLARGEKLGLTKGGRVVISR